MVVLAPRPISRTPERVRLLPALGLLAIVLLAFAVRLRLLTHGAGLASSDGYDDGVYYAAADALVHGRLPYRDFLLLHPPGIVLALAPFASLGSLVGDHVGVAVARLCFIGLGALGAGAVAVLAARYSRGAAAVAGLIAAVLFPLAYAERSTLLEPLGTAIVLGALLLLTRWEHRAAPVVAGALAGASVDVKAWFVVPVVVLLVWSRGRRRPFAVGVAAGAAALALPFLLAAPTAMVQQVVLDQLGRPRSAGTLVKRLVTIAGDPVATLHGSAALHTAMLLAALLVGVAVVGIAATWTIRSARVFAALTVATGAALLTSPSFFLHYAGFVLPFAAICTGVGWSRLVRAVPRREVRAGVLLAVVALVALASAPGDLRAEARPQPVLPLRAYFAGHPGCVVSDDPGLLANIDVLSPDLAKGCPLWPDVTGWTYDRDRAPGAHVSRADDQVWQEHLLPYLESGDFLVLARRDTGLSDATKAEVRELPVVLRAGRLRVRAIR